MTTVAAFVLFSWHCRIGLSYVLCVFAAFIRNKVYILFLPNYVH